VNIAPLLWRGTSYLSCFCHDVPGKIGEACPAGYPRKKASQIPIKKQEARIHPRPELIRLWYGSNITISGYGKTWNKSSSLGAANPRRSPEEKQA